MKSNHSERPYAKLGFDFYGHGNVGDDMMLAGFLKLWPKYRPLFCKVSHHQRQILRHRFPSITWIVDGENEPEYDLWLGVGDTPIQVLSGLFFLEYLERELEQAKIMGAKIIFLGIGAESEAIQERLRFSKVLKNIDLILTRDEASQQILVRDFAVDSSTVFCGEDLAHIYLQELMASKWDTSDRPLDIAVNFYSENMSRRQTLIVLRWLRAQQAMSRSAAYLSNEARMLDGLETRRYTELAWITCLNPRKEGIAILTPNRWAANLDDLVAHFVTTETVLSSRYHCLLSAAWAGCRTFGLGRSSKIAALCQDMQIEYTSGKVLSQRTLDRGMGLAKRIPFSLLNSKAIRAREMMGKVLALVYPDFIS